MAKGDKKPETPAETRPAIRPRWPSLWSDIDEFFERAMRPWPSGLRSRLARGSHWMPEMDVFEKSGNLVVRADVPGVKREDIDVSVEGDVLTISGHREEEKEVKEENFYSTERAVGRFSRSIRVPEGVTPDAIEATFEDGVLTVTVPQPKAKKPSSTKVEVK